MRSKRTQAVMEFMAQYMWAIVISLAAFSALLYFGILEKPDLFFDRCVFPAGLSCKDFKFDSVSSNVKIYIKNNQGDAIQNISVYIPGCTAWRSGALYYNNHQAFLAIIEDCSFPPGKAETIAIIEYTKKESELKFRNEGTIKKKIGDDSSPSVVQAQDCDVDSDCTDLDCKTEICLRGKCSHIYEGAGTACSLGVCNSTGGCN